MQGEEYKAVKTFCYLGDILDAGGGVNTAVTARIRSGWNKFRELQPFLTSKAPSLKIKGKVYAACVRSRMSYASETWATKAEDGDKLERAEMRMIRWMSGVTSSNRRTNEELRERMG